MTESAAVLAEPWMVALDIDGTLMREDGDISSAVIEQVQRVRDLGHEVMIATGRSVASTLPVLARFELTPAYVVCCNGAITLKLDADAPSGYSRIAVDSFDPTEVLTHIRGVLQNASFAVEDEEGLYRYTGTFPESSVGAISERVDFDELLHRQATRVVVISPEHGIEEFLGIVEKMGLHRVTYNVGYTAWLDIAPDGVNKATALERVREWLDIPRSRVIAVGDGRNDIDMLKWASHEGRGVSMGQAPDEVVAASNEATLSDVDDGIAVLFRNF